MKYAFETYEQFLEINNAVGRKISRDKAIQIRKIWKEKELAGEQWWATYTSYSTRREETGTVNDIFGDILDFSTYLTNPGSFVKIFEDIQESGIDSNNEELSGYDNKIIAKVEKKIEQLGGVVLEYSEDNKFKVKLNGEINWWTYGYIMNQL